MASGSFPDWRTLEDYRWLSSLSPSGWAWEFLRRNRRYQAAATAAQPRLPYKQGVDVTDIDAELAAEGWGLERFRIAWSRRPDRERILARRCKCIGTARHRRRGKR